jgi:hypothetical protein
MPGRWDVGIKLFELPRRGALIAFHGTVSFAHTLIQHLEHDLLTRPELNGPRVDLHDLVRPIREHFSQLFNEFRGVTMDAEQETLDDWRNSTGFLLGGWSWRQQAHAIWRFNFDGASMQFVATEVTRISDNLFAFVGDGAAAAEEELKNIAVRPLGMDALRVLHARTDPDSPNSSVGGSMQAAKVYASGQVEFLAVAWPTVDSDIFRRAARYSRGEFHYPVYLDPVTGEEMGILPECLPITENYDWGPEEEFIRDCYPSEDGFALRENLRDHERLRLVAALKAVGYERLIQSFSIGHTVAAKLLTSQVLQFCEIVSHIENKEVQQEMMKFLLEPHSAVGSDDEEDDETETEDGHE